MSADYEINVDPKGVMRYRLWGFFDPPTLARFSADRASAAHMLTCPRNTHVTIIDVSECVLQSQDAVMSFARLLGDPATKSRRLAFVVRSSLSRMQVRRLIAGRSDMAMFETATDAEAWVLAPEARAA